MFKKGIQMIIIGHKAIAYSSFVKITSIDEISSTNQSCIVWFDSSTFTQEEGLELAKHCCEYEVRYAVMIYTLSDLLLYAALLPQYLIIPKSVQHKAKQYQAIIEHYLLDCKLLCVIKSNAQLAKIAQMGIDGVIFKQVLDNIPSLQH